MFRPPVLSKADFVRRYADQEFGNASPTWNGIEGFLESGYCGKIHIRNRVANGPTWYNVESDQVEVVWDAAMLAGCIPESLYISAMAPTELTLIQGELCQLPRGLNFFYSLVHNKPMRDALAQKSDTAVGATALTLLRHFLNPISFDWLMELLDFYPGHVVEFSTYDVCWGTLPGFNTVYWEVRAY